MFSLLGTIGLALAPRNGLPEANGFVLVVNALNGLLLLFLVSLLVALLNKLVELSFLVENILVPVEVSLPNRGLLKFELLSENSGLDNDCEFLLELLVLLVNRLLLLLFDNGNKLFFTLLLVSLLMSKSFVCSVILFALIFGLSSEFNCESFLFSSLFSL